MEQVGCEFYNHHDIFQKCPYVEKVFEYNKSEGTLLFSGHYSVDDSLFPQTLYMNIYKIKKTVFVYKDKNGWDQYKTIYDFYDKMIVEIYRRELYEDISLDGVELSEDPEENIIFFPTHKQKIWFRILETENNLQKVS